MLDFGQATPGRERTLIKTRLELSRLCDNSMWRTDLSKDDFREIGLQRGNSSWRMDLSKDDFRENGLRRVNSTWRMDPNKGDFRVS
jgi:hypothetical protein